MRGGLSAAALALALTGAGSTAAAAEDLDTLLAPPPSSDWIELSPSTDVLAGSFTAHSYAVYVQGFYTTPVTTEDDLTRYGMLAGYAREWGKRSSSDYLQERVFQFASNAGARFWYGELRNQNATSKYYLRDITGLEGIPDSFGVVLSYANGDGREARVEFMKGDLTFVVHMGSNGTDYSAQAVHQALLESRRANAPSATHGPAANRTLMVAGGIAIGGVAIATALILVLLALIRPWHRQSGGRLRLSPDGRYWWDGATWRPTGPGP